MKRAFLLLSIGAFGVALGGACSSPDGNARVVAGQPDRVQFASVSPVLTRRCGSLDCHGEIHRNLRLYGWGGLRKRPGDSPDAPNATFPYANELEIDANYEAVVSLEPEITNQVVREKGASPERLSLIRKARLLEKHAGGRPITAGEDADVCLTTWLAGAADIEACKRGVPPNSR
jgi:hypothetical protein